jgi:major type 1 subunit fimbrin (pilin)
LLPTSSWRLLLCALATVAGFWAGGNAWATDGTITVSGTIKATTCSVTAAAGTTIPTSGSTPSLTITLPTISWQSISASGAAAGNTPFSIGVYGCGSTANTMAVNFETSNSMSSSGVITISSGTLGGGTGSYMRLLNANQTTPVTPGTPTSWTTVTSGGAGQTFYVQWYNGTGSTLTNSNVGSATATLTYTINYT